MKYRFLCLMSASLGLSACGDESDTKAVAPSCEPELLQLASGAPLVYTTRDCWTVEVDKHTITITDPSRLSDYQTWGDPHENMSGKHVKDWLSSRRSIAFGGAKVTMLAEGMTGAVETLTIYDGPRSYRIANIGNLILDQTFDETSTLAREEGEADGEAGCLANKADGGMLFDNVYQEDGDADGKPLARVPSIARIAETFGPDNPNQVNDFYPPLPGDASPAAACVASKP